ncbi:MAG: tetratricopeptide repeat protein [Bryobacteraceae bacterium]
MSRVCVLLLFVATFLPGQSSDELERLSDQARAALASKNWEQAAQALQKLARLAPTVPQVYANLGLALFFEGKSSEALVAFEKARKLNPDLPQVSTMIGLCDAELGRYPEAVAILAPAFEHPPDEETGRLIGLHLTRSYSAMRQFDKALVIGEDLVRRYPNDAEILYQVSRLHSDRSYALMAELVRTSPDSAWTHYANGQVQESLDHFDAAAQEYRNALQRDPRLPGAHYRLGRVILAAPRKSDSIEQARTEFEKELAISPRQADAEYELGEIQREDGNLKQALDHFERALRYHPAFEEARIGIARTLIKMDRPAEALPHLTEAVKLDPSNKTPHYLLASVHKSLGNAAEAKKEFAEYQKLAAASHGEDR